MITQERLKELLHYDPATGVFTRLVRCGSRALVGQVVGTRDGAGYLKVCIDRKYYLLHRLAWLWVHGEMPPDQIDHINGQVAENQIANLRPATHTENMRNSRKRKTNTSGFKGVCYDKETRKHWVAQISVDGRVRAVGRFDTPEEAHAAYCKAAIELHGDFARLA